MIRVNNFAVFLKEAVDNVTPETLTDTLTQFHTMDEELDLVTNVVTKLHSLNLTMLSIIYRDRLGNNIDNLYITCIYKIIRVTRASAWSEIADVDSTFLLKNANKLFDEYYGILKSKRYESI